MYQALFQDRELKKWVGEDQGREIMQKETR